MVSLSTKPSNGVQNNHFTFGSPIPGRYTVWASNSASPYLKCTSLAVKRSWQGGARHDNERELYTAAGALIESGKDGSMRETEVPFGVPAVLAAEKVISQEGQDHETIAISTFPESKMLRRVHMYTLFATVGRSLDECTGPRQLVRVISQAIIGGFSKCSSSPDYAHLLSPGHLTYFSAGWIHRDVSVGNMLILNPVETRKQFEMQVILDISYPNLLT